MDFLTPRIWVQGLIALLTITALSVLGIPSAGAEDDPEPTSTTTPSPEDEASEDDALGGNAESLNSLDIVLADIQASTAASGAEDGPEAPAPVLVDLVIAPIAPAEKGPPVDWEPPCAVERSGSSSSELGFSAEELAEAARRELYGAPEEEILADIVADRAAAQNADPMSRAAADKPVKSPTNRAHALLQDEQVNVEAVHQILNDLIAAEEAARDAVSSAFGAPLTGCDIYYFCGAERVDDIISGQIDSEPSGAYADYVTAVASNLAILTANIRNAESTPPLSDGETAPTIPSPTSPESVLSLTNYLADQGLGEPPADLHLPVFNYCRIDTDGPIETDTTVDPSLQPSFSWTPVDQEFDIDGSSDRLADEITRTLYGKLPQTRTIPPIETGIAIVQFPAWLWLNEPHLSTDLEAISDLEAIRIQARATFDHVTWTVGDTELECTLDDMKTYTPDTGMNPAIDTPRCHHIFTQLGDTTMNATVTYRLEQSIATRSLGYPWPADNWQPHPTTPTVDVTSTTATLTVAPITSVNVPIDITSD